MPDPRFLKVGDRIRLTSMPDEWSVEGYTVMPESVSFMKAMIRRTWPSRIVEIDEYGSPWIHARVRFRGKLRFHSWAIMESTGWRRVKRRT